MEMYLLKSHLLDESMHCFGDKFFMQSHGFYDSSFLTR
jgi:hypothetical protein